MPGPYLFVNHYGYDRAKKSFTYFGTDNVGTVDHGDVAWDGDVLISVKTSKYEGHHVLDRWTTTVTGARGSSALASATSRCSASSAGRP